MLALTSIPEDLLDDLLCPLPGSLFCRCILINSLPNNFIHLVLGPPCLLRFWDRWHIGLTTCKVEYPTYQRGLWKNDSP